MSRPNRTRNLLLVILAVILVAASAPVWIALLASTIADFNGCELSMGSRQACMIAGADWSPTLLAMSLAPWFLFYSFPLGLFLLLIWLVVFLVHRSRSAAGPQP